MPFDRNTVFKTEEFLAYYSTFSTFNISWSGLKVLYLFSKYTAKICLSADLLHYAMGLINKQDFAVDQFILAMRAYITSFVNYQFDALTIKNTLVIFKMWHANTGAPLNCNFRFDLIDKIINDNSLEDSIEFINASSANTQQEFFYKAIALCHIPILSYLSNLKNSVPIDFELIQQINCYPINNDDSFARKQPFIGDEQKINMLKNQLLSSFAPDDEKLFHLLFPFTNEYAHETVINQLKLINRLEYSGALDGTRIETIRVALLFGQSNFPSLLPHLIDHVELVILGDIEPLQLLHLQHLINCLERSTSRKEFIRFYLTNNPIMYAPLTGSSITKLTRNILKLQIKKNMCGPYFFLEDEETFISCQKAVAKLKPIVIKLDLLNVAACEKFAKVLQENDSRIRVCNVTNIYSYDTTGRLDETIPIVLPSPDDAFALIMYSVGPLNNLYTSLCRGIKNYSTDTKKKGTVIPLVIYYTPKFFRKASNRSDEFHETQLTKKG